MKKQLAFLLCLILMMTAVLSACGNKVVSSGSTGKSGAKATQADPTSAPSTKVTFYAKSTEPLLSIDDVPEADLSEIDTEYQGAAPKAGEEVAILHTSMGDIYMRFFTEVAPKAVYSFKALARAGRFDNTIFHRITTYETAGCEVIQAGDYTRYNGTGGASAYGEPFGLEISDYLSNIRGSVAMANSGAANSNGSQFYISTSNNNNLDGKYTVFAQVYDGMDVVDSIHSVERNSDVPVTIIYINSVEIVEYQ